MMRMRWTTWVGFLMMLTFIFIAEPIWPFIFDESGNILWIIPAVIYLIVGATLIILGAIESDKT